MPELKTTLRTDLTAAMKAREPLRVGTLRMALAAITTEEVAGDTARELSDAEVVTVLTREMRKRKEASEAFSGAGRAELADKENAEAEVLRAYLPAQLDDAELTELAREEVAALAAHLDAPPTMKNMGQVVKAVQARVAGRAEGGRIAAAVRAALGARP